MSSNFALNDSLPPPWYVLCSLLSNGEHPFSGPWFPALIASGAGVEELGILRVLQTNLVVLGPDSHHSGIDDAVCVPQISTGDVSVVLLHIIRKGLRDAIGRAVVPIIPA